MEISTAFAGALRKTVRESDVAGRWGGEEFALVLPGTDAAGGARLAERARATIEARQVKMPNGDLCSVTASFGVASFPESHELGEILAAADWRSMRPRRGRTGSWSPPSRSQPDSTRLPRRRVMASEQEDFMAVDTSSMFSQVIQDHLELKRRNAALEHEMPLGKYMDDDPFENHPLFKTEEQARFEDTMDGVQGIEAETTRSTGPRPKTRSSIRPQPSRPSLRQPKSLRPPGPMRTQLRTRTSGRARATSTGATRQLVGQGFAARYGSESRAHKLSSIFFIGQNVAEPPKSSTPAANTLAPVGVS